MAGLYDSLMKSNMSSESKGGVIEKWIEGIQGTGIARVRSHALATGHAIRSGGESVVIAGALAAAHVELKDGLDVTVNLPGQNKPMVLPLDGLTALAGITGSIALSGEEVGTDLRNAGNAALSIFTFRKTFAFLSAKKKLAGGVPGGTFGGEGDVIEQSARSTVVDPVVIAAKRITG